MIKVEVMDDGVVKSEINGKLSAIISESLASIRAVYVSLVEQSEDAGKLYKKMFKKHIDVAFDEDAVTEILEATKNPQSEDPLKDFHEAAKELLKTLTEDD